MHNERRGLRFAFSARAELQVEGSPAGIPCRVSELSLHGCFLEITGSFAEHQPVRVKIFKSGEFFEAAAKVIYVRPSGVGMLFTDMKPHFRTVLQRWILGALDQHVGQATEVAT